MFTRRDSWSAVAIPIVAARAGIPRTTGTAATSAAFSACSGDRVHAVPSSSAVHSCRGSTSGLVPSRPFTTPATASPPTATTSDTPARVLAARRARLFLRRVVDRWARPREADMISWRAGPR
ncbi:hypothetical protein JAV76_09205 [Sanguibacter sp. YZGR15]|uniref:Uncharacterized protein n=1 Tax=Sanguibacter suaedae TaxID=2795737 RepID=A0A934MDX1_9MICO|nr:hypothetical protein [Sanguibacter suaedae]MBI9115184.1 hypothetical protein [Sanguibacter suaedae]